MGSICSCCRSNSKHEKDVRSSLIDSTNSTASSGVYRSATLVVPSASSIGQPATAECSDTTTKLQSFLSASNLPQSEGPSNKADDGVRSY